MAPTAPAIDVHPRAPGNLVCTLTSRLSGTAQRVTVVETRAPSVPLADRSWRYSKITPPMSCGTQAASQKTGPVRFPIEPGGAFRNDLNLLELVPPGVQKDPPTRPPTSPRTPLGSDSGTLQSPPCECPQISGAA